MRKPWFKAQSGAWVVTLPGGRVKTLGKDPLGATRKNPPRPIVEAWHALLAEAGDALPGEERRPKDMRLRQLCDAYVESLAHPKTRADTRYQLDLFARHMGDVKVSQIRVHQVLAYLDGRKGWNSTSKATALERITSAINWAIGVQRLDKAYRLEVPKSLKPRRQKRKHVIAEADQAKLEAAAYPPLRAVLKGLRLSGARPGELCGALIEHCDLKKGTLKVLNKTREQTGEDYRTLYLSAEMAEHLKGAIGKRKAGHVFLRGNGTPWTPKFLGHMIWKTRKRAGLPDTVVAYAVRHTWASRAINEGNVNPALVARAMGHADLTMLLRTYFKEDPEAMRKAVEEATK